MKIAGFQLFRPTNSGYHPHRQRTIIILYSLQRMWIRSLTGTYLKGPPSRPVYPVRRQPFRFLSVIPVRYAYGAYPYGRTDPRSHTRYTSIHAHTRLCSRYLCAPACQYDRTGPRTHTRDTCVHAFSRLCSRYLLHALTRKPLMSAQALMPAPKITEQAAGRFIHSYTHIHKYTA